MLVQMFGSLSASARRYPAALLCGSVLAIGAPAAAAPVGTAIGVQGKAEYRAKGAAAWAPLQLRRKLEAGDAVRCAAGGQATLVLFSTGERFQVPAGKEVLIALTEISGATSLGKLQGPSARVALALAGAPTGVVRARPAPSHRRLQARGPCWLVEGTRKLQWDPEAGGASYALTLFDQADNVVWSQRTVEPAAEYPEGLAPLGRRRPYLWKLTVFGRSGKPVASRWGLITVLSAADAERLAVDEKDLLAAAQAAPEDVTPRLLLADLYQSYGVLERTLEVLDDLRPSGQPGLLEALDETYRQISPMAHMLYTQSQNAP
jgi:hypothetical protein